jgi:hypothetical protein
VPAGILSDGLRSGGANREEFVPVTNESYPKVMPRATTKRFAACSER